MDRLARGVLFRVFADDMPLEVFERLVAHLENEVRLFGAAYDVNVWPARTVVVE